MTKPILFISFILIAFLQVSGQQPISISKRTDGSLTIKNSYCGLIVPSDINIKQKDSFLAPIQSFILANGNQTDKKPNFLKTISAPVSAKTSLLESGDSVIFTARYTFNDGAFYLCKIKLLKNSRSIVIEEDANTDLSYKVGIGSSSDFDKAQYRGWSSTSPELGAEPDGRQYREEHQRPPVDAVMDINFNTPSKYPFLSNWDPAGGEVNTGRYWQLYKKSGVPTDNMFGIFQGRPSRLIGNKFIGVRFVTSPGPAQKEGTIELEMEIVRRGPDNSYAARKRFQWCSFIATRKEVLPANSFQPIGLEMNRVSGVASRVDDYCKKKLQINESFLKGVIYMPEQQIQQLVQKVKKDGEYYKQLSRTIPSFRSSLDAWRFPDSALSLKRSLLEDYQALRKDLTERDGSHTFYLKYWMGSISYKRIAMKIAALFADSSIQVSAEEKEKLMELMRLMARIQWDDNYVPFFDSSGINFGTANMNYQYRNNGRNFFALLFSNDPEFKERAKTVLEQTRKDLLSAVASNGTSFASPHYTQATIDPILFNMLQLKQAGIGDLFKEQKAVLTKFIGFYSSLLTPRSVRFKGYRKLVSFGDGSEESAPTFALLGAGFHDVDKTLSNNLYYIFENGGQRQSLFGELGLAVELGRHEGKFSGASANFTDFLSHARTDVDTDTETATWIINGETYSDHRNQDRGEAIIYALGAPLSLSRNSFYTPHAPDARIRSLVIPEKLFPSWKGDNQPINGEDKLGDPWTSSKVTDYAKLPSFTSSTSLINGKNNNWSRRSILIHAIPEEPVMVFYDSLDKDEAAVWSMNFMSAAVKENATLPVATRERLHNGGARAELPSGTPEKRLAAGWNQFDFTGQQWNKHPSGGINWDLYTYSGTPSSYSMSKWTTTWQNTEEIEEFRETNGQPYVESQDILRWRSAKPFFAVIVPRKKGASAIQAKKTSQAAIELNSGNRRYLITPSYFVLYRTDGSKTIGIYSDRTETVDGSTFSGGNMNVTITKDKVTVQVSGKTGKRNLTLPFGVTSSDAAKGVKLNDKGNAIEIYHEGALDIGPAEQGFREYIFIRN